MPDDLAKFLEEAWEETRRAGPEAMAQFETYNAQYALARQLFDLRKARRWTQQQLARKSGVQQSEISRIERGEGNPTLATLCALTAALGVQLSFTFDAAPERKLPRQPATAQQKAPPKRQQKSVPVRMQRQASAARTARSKPRT